MAREDSDKTTTPEIITPADFTPADGRVQTDSRRIKPLYAALIGFSFLAIAVLWFLFAARAVVFRIEPATATLDVDGGIAFNIGHNYLLLDGEYRYRATAKGYREETAAFTASPDNAPEIDIQLEPLPGKLDIQSTPEGATVSIDGKAVGRTPGVFPEIERGNHEILLELARYFPKKSTLSVEGLDRTQNLSFELDPAWGELLISSQPAGAEVSVSGEVRGVTPLKTELLQAGESVELRLAGYRRWQQNLSVAAGEYLELPTIQLVEADGTIRLSSTPSGASVTLNGVYQGLTPLEMDVASRQSHAISLMLEGYERATRSMRLKPGEQKPLQVSLSPQMGVIRVRVFPADARIEVDGRDHGKGSQSLRLTARSHQLRVVRDGYVAQTQSITPRPGHEQSLSISLLTEKEAYWNRFPKTIKAGGGISLKLFRPDDSFHMGSPRRDPGRRANEVIRNVALNKAFYLGLYEITNDQLRRFLPRHSSGHLSGVSLDMGNQPAVNVSWQDAALFCNWLSEQDKLPPYYEVTAGRVTGVDPEARGYRLPTEAEWSWAARIDGKTKISRYPWGDDYPPPKNFGNYADALAKQYVALTVPDYSDGYPVSAPVGSFNPNAKGLYDIEGNVSEWIHDYYAIQFVTTETLVNPLGPPSGDLHVIRGSSWRHGSRSELRSTYRDFGAEPRQDVGFRMARNAE